jgi:transposase InsO family protein
MTGVPLSETAKMRIYQGKLQGQTLAELAAELGYSVACVRKWWRRARDQGLQGLQSRRRGPPTTSILGRFDPPIGQTALALKRRHPGWGADRVLVEMRTTPQLQGMPLPSRSRLAAFFKVRCPECITRHQPQPAPPPAPSLARAVHQVWQLDAQEGIRLQDGTIATLCNIRDPVGAAMIASRAFAVQTARHWRKLTWQEYRQVLRDAFTEWQTLPDAVQTDHELGIAGSPTDPYPGPLTLWLVGLDIEHRLSRPHQPTDQAQVERNHRTLDGFALDEASRANLTSLQQALDRERRLYHEHFPTRAGDCDGQPPLVVHPELRAPRRPYRPDWELALFDLRRVELYLATFTFQRKVSSVGRVSLGRRMYSVGRPWAGKIVKVRFDPDQRQWVFLLPSATGEGENQEIARRAIKGLDVQTLTGLDPEEVVPASSVQLPLPGVLI